MPWRVDSGFDASDIAPPDGETSRLNRLSSSPPLSHPAQRMCFGTRVACLQLASIVLEKSARRRGSKERGGGT